MENPIPKVKQYYGETVQEVKKCSWPPRTDLAKRTVIVIASVVMFTAFISLADFVLGKMVFGIFQKLPELLN